MAFSVHPQDNHDWDGNQIPVIADIPLQGRERKVVMVASRNGFFYIFDRAKGELLLAKPFTATRWAREIGPDGDRRIEHGLRAAWRERDDHDLCSG